MRPSLPQFGCGYSPSACASFISELTIVHESRSCSGTTVVGPHAYVQVKEHPEVKEFGEMDVSMQRRTRSTGLTPNRSHCLRRERRYGCCMRTSFANRSGEQQKDEVAPLPIRLLTEDAVKTGFLQ